MNYTQRIIDYIIEHESEDFWHWVDLDSDEALDDEERELLLKQGSSDHELDLAIMRRLASKHVYAAAYLLDKGIKS